MARATHAAASLLLAAGIVLVFAGFSSALGLTPAGILGSLAAIAGLLYAGGVWFGPSAPAATGALIFDHRLDLTNGTSLLSRFPEPFRAELRARCHAALAGERTRFALVDRVFQALPVVDADGVMIYGVLLEGTPSHAAV